MKLLFDFLPIILFFGTFKFADANKVWASDIATDHLSFAVLGGSIGPDEAPVLLATAAVILATAGQVAWLRLRGRKVEAMLWVSLVLVVLLGGMTIHLRSEVFIKWKPSVLYWVMGLAFWLSPLLLRKNLLKLLLGEQLQLPARVWHRLNFAWIAFFGVMGFLNLWVAFHFSTDTWVNFKLFGSLGLMLIFTVAQGLYLGSHLKHDAPPRAGENRP